MASGRACPFTNRMLAKTVCFILCALSADDKSPRPRVESSASFHSTATIPQTPPDAVSHAVSRNVSNTAASVHSAHITESASRNPNVPTSQRTNVTTCVLVMSSSVKSLSCRSPDVTGQDMTDQDRTTHGRCNGAERSRTRQHSPVILFFSRKGGQTAKCMSRQAGRQACYAAGGVNMVSGVYLDHVLRRRERSRTGGRC